MRVRVNCRYYRARAPFRAGLTFRFISEILRDGELGSHLKMALIYACSVRVRVRRVCILIYHGSIEPSTKPYSS